MRLILSLLAVCAPLLVMRDAAAQDTKATPDPIANAAIQYWQAFTLMPPLDKEQEKILEEWQAVPLGVATDKLISASQTSLMYLHRGAKLQHCDWGLEPNDGAGLLMPHLSKARALSRLAALRARSHFEQGDWKAGRQDASDVMVLGRHVGRDPIMISILVRYVIEGATIDAIAPHVTKIKADLLQAAQMYEGLPRAATLQEAILMEKQYMLGSIVKQLKEADDWNLVWQQFLQGSEDVEEIKQIDKLERIVGLIEQLAPTYEELAKLVALPKSEFDAKYPAFKEKTKAANPLARTILPAVDKILATEQRHQARVAMLLAGIAVAQEGPDAIKKTKDPFGDGPFQYQALDQGFELKSKLMHEGKPVTLTLGQPARP